ncbi:antigen 5 like allergen Cul n 1-like isoform X2 [Armigeres subalbatus]|uniref:antigen 5 like allergen Cul n 1-like isoform X2 n=1 Tax=Armigeres subalbatus TaxID=124917 RepID=UPI002ED270F4
MKVLISVTIVACIAVTVGQSTNYCDRRLCPSGSPHIACNGLTTLSRTCGAGSFEIAMDSANRQLIVDLHNKLRSRVASGRQTNSAGQRFQQAARMATLQWDSELAHIAATNARRCIYGHDQCRNTATMRASGQNIAIMSYYGMTVSNEKLLTDFTNSWFSEFKDTTPQQIARYPSNYRGPAIGHFTQIVSDRTSRIGCAMVSYNRQRFINKLLVCNYGLTNIVNQPVYVAGNSCSGCTTGCNSQYPGLCNTAENVRNNP